MFGCLRRLGCLTVLLVGGALYIGRDLWLPQLRQRVAGEPARPSLTEDVWEPLDPDRAQRGERAVRALAERSGPVYVNLRAGELASYVFLSLSDALPPALRDAEAAVIGDRIVLRSEVSASDLGGAAGGIVGSLLAERDTLRLAGTLEVIRPGMAELRIREVQVGRVPVPAALVPRIIASMRRGSAAADLAPDALAVPVPPYIGDVRIGRGRITLYRAAAQ